MAKIAAKTVKNSINAVALQLYIDSISLNVDQETPEVTAFADAGPRVVPGNYNWGQSFSGMADFTAALSDATIFATLANTGVAMDFDPTGVAAAANNPHYTGTVVLKSYKLSAAKGGAVAYSADYAGHSALTRAVA